MYEPVLLPEEADDTNAEDEVQHELSPKGRSHEGNQIRMQTAALVAQAKDQQQQQQGEGISRGLGRREEPVVSGEGESREGGVAGSSRQKGGSRATGEPGIGKEGISGSSNRSSSSSSNSSSSADGTAAGTATETLGEPGTGKSGNSASSNSSSSNSSSSADAAAAGAATETIGGAFVVVGPSKWWRGVRASEQGHEFVRSVLQQLLMALDAVHAANMSHRDVKPENLLMMDLGGPWDSYYSGNHAGGRNSSSSTEDSNVHSTATASSSRRERSGGQGGKRDTTTTSSSSSSSMPEMPEASGSDTDGDTAATNRHLPNPSQLHLRLIDFGSAVDLHSLSHLYGKGGPGLGEMTLEYAPPEVLFGSKTWSGGATITPEKLHSYDIWSAGVVFLELILGSPHVFQLSPGTQKVLDAKLHLGGRSQGERQLIYLLRGMMELCIYPPQVRNV